ncbi:MAG: hypothetical protein ABFS41_18975, partial [Myxococcota bacterium]
MAAMRWTRREVLAGGAAWAASALLPGRAFSEAAGTPLSAGGFALGLQSFTLRKLPLEPMLDAVVRLGLREVELIPETSFLFYELGSHLPVTAGAAALEGLHAALEARS